MSQNAAAWAKPMLDRIDTNVVAAGLRNTGLEARVNLAGDDGGLRCARVDPPAITWSSAAADG